MDMIYANFVDLQRFADGGTLVNATGNYINAYTGAVTAFSGNNTMSPTMKTYYDTELLENARSKHYYAQFGRKQPLPRNRGKFIEWRKWNTLPMAEQLTEGVIPTGKKLGMTYITSGIKQYGLYVSVTDQLELHALDDVILGATEELGASAGDTQDVAIRNVLMEGTNVMYAMNSSNSTFPTSRQGLAKTCRLTPDMVARAATQLKKMKAEPINGKYIAIIHPSVAYDLRSSQYWIEAHKYAQPGEIYNGEIGELHGVRFIETDTAPVLKGANLGTSNAYLTLTAAVTNASTTADYGDATAYRLTVSETIGKDLVGRWVNVWDASATSVTANCKIVGINTTNKYIYLNATPNLTYASGDLIYPGEGTISYSGGTVSLLAVYGCMFFGKEAYGIIDPDGAGMEMITKTKDQIGGPLNQFSTLGYKFSGGTKILYEDRLLRVECCSEFSDVDAGNYGPIALAT